MGFLLSRWPAEFRHTGPPPLALVLPFLDPPAPNTGHVGWNGVDLRQHPEADFNSKNEAVYIWPPDGVFTGGDGKTRTVGRLRFPVVRVLYWYEKGAREPRTVIRNVCGISACCNPDHWRIVTSAELGDARRIQVFTAFGSSKYGRLR